LPPSVKAIYLFLFGRLRNFTQFPTGNRKRNIALLAKHDPPLPHAPPGQSKSATPRP
jgi:hypothetical protein